MTDREVRDEALRLMTSYPTAVTGVLGLLRGDTPDPVVLRTMLRWCDSHIAGRHAALAVALSRHLGDLGWAVPS